jgi:hypothetical protein
MRRTLSVIGGAVLAVVLSQFPEYAQQYTQRLGGAVDELRIITEEFDHAATEAGLTRTQALARYEATGDTFIEGRGLSADRTFARYADLKERLERIRGATGWERAALLPDYLDTDIGARALENFQPAVPVTAEGLAYGGVGFLLGYGFISALVRLLLMPFRRHTYWRDPRLRDGI